MSDHAPDPRSADAATAGNAQPSPGGVSGRQAAAGQGGYGVGPCAAAPGSPPADAGTGGTGQGAQQPAPWPQHPGAIPPGTTPAGYAHAPQPYMPHQHMPSPPMYAPGPHPAQPGLGMASTPVQGPAGPAGYAAAPAPGYGMGYAAGTPDPAALQGLAYGSAGGAAAGPPPGFGHAAGTAAGQGAAAPGVAGRGRQAGLAEVLDELSNGGNGLSSLTRMLSLEDSDFWKGALVGAAAVLLFTNDSVQDALFKSGARAKSAVRSGADKLKQAAADAADQN